MEDLIRFIPTSVISLVGLAVILVILIMVGTVAQEWGKWLYRAIRGNKEKRHGEKFDYNGVDRRNDDKALQNALTNVLNSVAENSHETRELIITLRKSQEQVSEGIEEIKRAQGRNWKRLFDEELPQIRSV